MIGRSIACDWYAIAWAGLEPHLASLGRPLPPYTSIAEHALLLVSPEAAGDAAVDEILNSWPGGAKGMQVGPAPGDGDSTLGNHADGRAGGADAGGGGKAGNAVEEEAGAAQSGASAWLAPAAASLGAMGSYLNPLAWLA